MTRSPGDPADQQPAPDPPPTTGNAAPDEGETTPAGGRTIDRKLLDDIFGDVLPDTTADERGAAGGYGSEGGYSEEWYRDNRPPHHDG